MMQEVNAKKSKVKTLMGLVLILFGIVCLIDTGYVIQSLVLAIIFIFGFFGYWFIFPSFIVFGVYLILTRNKEFKFKLNQLVIGIGLLMFSLLVLLTIINYPSAKINEEEALHFSNFNQLFYQNWLKAISIRNYATNYYWYNPLYYRLGGGWLGHLFSSLVLLVPQGVAFALTAIIIFIASVLIFYKQILKLFNKIKTNRLNKKNKISETQEQIIEKGLDDLEIPFEGLNESKNANSIEEEFHRPDELAKANLYSSDEDIDVSSLSATSAEGEELKSASLLHDDSPIAKDMPNLDKVEKKPLKPYKLPSLDLLKTYETSDIVAKNEESCAQNEAIINATFQYLKVGAKVVGHTIGPRVTRYDIQVDADSSIQKIPAVVRDLSQRLGGVSTHFEPIVAGKVTSGLEVPNKESSMIGFKEVVSVLPKGDKYHLMIPFGKNITGETKYADLAKFPHLLIGGATGSGKSVFVHSLIMTLIMRNTPSEVRLLLIDPKQVEFTHYKNSPFLLCPVVTDPRKAKVALEKLCEEMDRRYSLFASSLTRDIVSYNMKIKTNGGEPLPYIVTIVDEFADLIQQNKKIDQDISRITAKARAAGIHLVIATQRPSVDVITGVIKSNLPVRVALSVPDIESSKTILGGMGAEQLLGNGDMLISCPQIQTNGNVRAQGCYVTDQEIDDVVAFINAQREPQYDPRFMDLEDHTVQEVKSDVPKVSAAEARKLRDDDLYNYVKEQVYKREYTSISVIERENGIGFTRAGRLFKRLQDEGLVSLESEASKGSKVIKENFHFEESAPKVGSEEVSSTKPNEDK